MRYVTLVSKGLTVTLSQTTHRLFFGVLVKVKASDTLVDLEGQSQCHKASCFDVILAKVKTQQMATVGHILS